jgi:hypothetical protein
MLIFYQHTEDSFTHWVAEKMEEMVVAHKIVSVDDGIPLPDDISRKELPVLSDGHECWTSQEQIKQFLEKLHQDLLLSQSLQSDACFIDPDNPDTCL